MADGTDTWQPASARLARGLALPAPKPLTDDEERAYQTWMDDGDAQLATVIAHRTRTAA
jgi:hypothetical protein